MWIVGGKICFLSISYDDNGREPKGNRMANMYVLHVTTISPNA